MQGKKENPRNEQYDDEGHEYGSYLYRFDTKEDAENWLEVDGDHYDRRYLYWKSPGWYVKVCYSEPCGRGCCTNLCVKLVYDDCENEKDKLAQSKVGDTYTDDNGDVWKLTSLDPSGPVSFSMDVCRLSVVFGNNGPAINANGASEGVVQHALKVWKAINGRKE